MDRELAECGFERFGVLAENLFPQSVNHYPLVLQAGVTVELR